jgi:hypothetical protein
MKKRLFALSLTLLLLCAAPVSALAAEPSITASYSGGTVTFSGSVISGVKAVAVLLFDPDGDQIAMTTCAVTGDGAFSGSIGITLTSSGTYAVKAADYEGGDYFAQDSFNWTAPSLTPPPSAPVTVIGSGESVTASNIEKLVSEGASLTVEGENGAKLVFDTDSLKNISEQAGGSVEVKIADVSEEYRETHPGKLVFSLTVRSGDKLITDFGGSVTVSLPYELKEGESAETVTVWHLTASGILVEIPCTYDAATGLVSFKVSHFSVYIVGVAGEWANPFEDVSEADWFYDEVRFVCENGLMVGTGDAAFSPLANTSRGMIVTILWRLEGEPEAALPMSFTDVENGQWYYGAVAWAAEKGIVGGYDAARFGPGDDITREQMTKILYAYAHYKGYDVSARDDLSAFNDTPSSWALESVRWAVAESLIQGKGGGVLDPRGGAKRCECAAVLHRFLNMSADM